MTEIEAREVIQALREALGRHDDLTWIVRGVDETLKLGKPTVKTVNETRQVTVSSFDDSPVFYRREEEIGKRRRVEVATTEEYTSVEELRMLIDAIDRTVVAVSQMRPQVVGSFNDLRSDSSSIYVVQFERDNNLSAPLHLGEQILPEAKALEETLRALRERL